MSTTFEDQLKQSGWVHAPLPIPQEGTLEAVMRNKQVAASLPLWESGEGQWRHFGPGTLSFARSPVSDVSGLTGTAGHSSGAASVDVCLEAPARTESWPADGPMDGDYVNFGTGRAELCLPIGMRDWRAWNRLRFSVRPDCAGLRSPCLQVSLVNEGEKPIPDPHGRDGVHVIHLENGAWNDCIWEFPDLPRDCVTSLSFSCHLNGRDVESRLPAALGDLSFQLSDIRLERVAKPEMALGWQVQEGEIAVSSGYFAESKKIAVFGSMPNDGFVLQEEVTGCVVFTGVLECATDDRGTFPYADFSRFCLPGQYRVVSGGARSESFRIAAQPFREAAWKVLNFLFCERCGTPVSGRHGACHHDLVASHNGVHMTYAGGWHDAGDVSQQTAQSAEITQALFGMAMTLPKQDPLRIRMMEEAEWGLDFVLRTRFGDGYRASSAGATRWTDGLTGNFDDVPVRVHNHAMLNWLCAASEAQAAMSLRDRDPELARHCLAVAVADYGFAKDRFCTHGLEWPSFFEHTYPTPFSGYAALASWTASLLYEAGAGDTYAVDAVAYAHDLLRCQAENNGNPLQSGFFWRDLDKRVMTHYNHQSREQLPVQALARLLASQPDHLDAESWRNALRLYGAHLKALAGYTTPWDMLPAGLHRADETEDADTFRLLHLFADPETERVHYRAQLEAGLQVGADVSGQPLYLRRFPVWFSFRGNSAVHLAQGVAAGLVAGVMGDEALRDMARGQLYWLHGKNPFRQSLMLGEGFRYAQQYAVLPGGMTGSMPVGVQTLGDGDTPFWPQANNATYKEVWTSTATHWLRLVASLA